MSMQTETAVTTQVYRVYIEATPQAIWDAITKPEWTERYGYGSLAEYDLRPGGAYRAVSSDAMKKRAAEMGFPIPAVMVEGEVIEADPRGGWCRRGMRCGARMSRTNRPRA